MESIILVDDEQVLLESLSTLLGREFGAERIKSTTDPFVAQRWIEQEKPSILITDVRMSGLTGLELLSCASKQWGSVPVVLMTAYASPEIDSMICFGTFKYLPKPFQAKQLMGIVHDILSAPRQGFGGKIMVSMLADVIQLHALAWSTGALYIDSEGSGSVWFVKGQIVHAATVGAQGEKAFYQMVRWKGGAFSFIPDLTTAQTITAKNTELLLEAYRLRDEELRETPAPASQDLDDFDFDFDIIDEPPATSNSNNIKECLLMLESISGFIGGCLIDSQRGSCLGAISKSLSDAELENIASIAVRLFNAERSCALTVSGSEAVDEILLSLEGQYHLLRPIQHRPEYFFYAIFERARVNLAFARLSLHEVEKDLVV